MSYIDEKKEALLAIAFPTFDNATAQWIDNFRKKHDSLFYNVVEPHFGIIFSTFGIAKEDFIYEIREKCVSQKSFEIVIRSALINNDKLSEYCHILLTPDEGNSRIIKMHDYFYSGILRKTQRIDIDYVSHIGIGSYKDINTCKSLVDDINSQNIEFKMLIDSIDIISYGNQKVTKIEKVYFK